MSTVLKMNELNQIGKGIRLFSKDEGIRCIGMIASDRKERRNHRHSGYV